LLGDPALVQSVLADLETSRLDDQHKALFRFVDKVNRESPSITPADVDAVRAAGWSDESLYFAITVCALFNFYNRWIDAAGVHEMSEEAHRQYAERTAQHGYMRK
jgi:alkylhydroperoxidase family enzyme